MPPKADQTLPQKEAALFRQILRCYETKQYKKGLKNAEIVLKKFPEHGETLAMKGLTLNCMDKKKEAYDLVRLGLKHNMASHICWHVYGLLFRSDRDYKQAINCYVQALKRDTENGQILRDLSLLQIQTRDIHGFCETRRTLLSGNAKTRNNWIGFAIGNHLSGDLAGARRVLEAYETTIDTPEKNDNEHSEMLLYKNKVIFESGAVEEALQHLEKIEPLVMDKISWREYKAKYLISAGKLDLAKAAYMDLLEFNTENYDYHAGWLSAHDLPFPHRRRNETSPPPTPTREQCDRIVQVYSTLVSKFPRSAAVKRIPLDCMHGDDLKLALDRYMRPLLRKGMPSLFAAIESLYKKEENVAIIESLVGGYIARLTAELKLPALEGDEDKFESPDVLLWCQFFLAQHKSRINQIDVALSTIGLAIAHTPTLVDGYLVRARIFKRCGDYEAASDACEEARMMDLADRYLNTVSVKAALKADRLELAESVVTLFTKDGDNPNNLFEMQAMWYELRYGNACLRLGQYGRALKKFTQIEKHFGDIIEDQMDFHTYCLRKMTVRAYYDMLHMMDRVYGHRYFVKAALGCVRAYISLHDKPPHVQQEEEDAELAGLPEAERKKALAKKKRTEAKAALKKEEQAAKESTEQKGKKKRAVDADPEGETLASTPTPLLSAVTYLSRLEQSAPHNIDLHLLSCDVWVRLNKPLRVLQSAKRAFGMDKENPQVVLRVLRLTHMVAQCRASLPAPVVTVLDAQLSSSFAPLPVGSGAHALCDYLRALPPTLANRYAAAQATLELSPTAHSDACKLVLDSGVNLGSCFDFAQVVLKWIVSNKQTDAAAAFKKRCHAAFPHASYFKEVALAM